MATIETRGYVNRPEAKTGGKGGFSKFTLATKQKNGPGKEDTKVYFDVVDFKNSSPPEDGAYVTVSGYFSVDDYVSKKTNLPGKSLKINAQKVEVAPPLPGAASKPSQAATVGAPPAKDPWDDDAES